MLNSHPRIVAYSELLLEEGDGVPQWGGAKDIPFWSTYRRGRRRDGNVSSERELFAQYLNAVYAPITGTAAKGFKLMYGQAASHPMIEGYLGSRHVAVVHLIRRNLLNTLISRWLALSGGVFHTHASDLPRQRTVRLECATLIDQLATLEREIDAASERFGRSDRYLEVYYEDLAASQGQFDALLDFLNPELKTQQLTSRLRRIVEAGQRQVVENYEEVRSTLAESRFKAFLSDEK